MMERSPLQDLFMMLSNVTFNEHVNALERYANGFHKTLMALFPKLKVIQRLMFCSNSSIIGGLYHSPRKCKHMIKTLYLPRKSRVLCSDTGVPIAGLMLQVTVIPLSSLVNVFVICT